MKIIVDNCIKVEKPTDAVLNYCKKALVFDNPDYYKKVRLGKWTGNTPKQLYLYEKKGDTLVIPFGCLRDVWYLCPNADWDIKILPIKGVEYGQGINMYSYQENAVESVLRVKNGVLVMPCGSGKGLPVDARICTPTGWKRNGDLQIGDAVVGSDGKATRVTGIFDRGKVDAYKITFSDGVETICDKDHLWTVQKQSQRAESGNWNVMNAQAIYEHYQNMKCRSQYLYIPIVEPVEFYGYEDYRSMNPWLLGFLLGDGCFQKTMISMSTNENDIRKKVVDIIGKDYGACEWIIHKKNYDWRFCGGYTLHDIKSLGLECKHSYEKFIPIEYLFASVEVRLAVLQGLFDADGHISNGMTYEYSTTSKQLADDVVFIVESLGGTAKVKEKIPTYTYNGEKRTGRKAYRIFFKLYNFKPFTSEKHSAVYRERTHYNKAYRIIKKIEPCEPITSRCITVDAEDQLYVTEHFVVTHNTQCGLEVVRRVGGKALWLTHTQDLLTQSMLRAKNIFDLPDECYGTITAGRVNIGTHITFATVQTMCKIDLPKYKNVWDIIIVDEVQRVSGSPTRVTQFYKVLSNLTARYKIGLTATPKRNDGLERSMFALLGGIIHTVSREAVAEHTCKVIVKPIETGYIPDVNNITQGDGTLDYMALIDDLINNEDRFKKVLETIEQLDGSAIVLANRVAYLQRLNDEYSGRSVCLSGAGYTKKAKAERKAALEKLRCGDIDIVFSTYALASEGLDVPNLRYVVFCTPEKNETCIVQSAGRVGRKADGKEYGTVIDFVDDFTMYQKWYKTRLGYYKKIDAEVIE